jgi:hypothetical protein
MTSFKLLGATAILSALLATPTLAQPMIEEPGLYAFFHPNGDLGIGSTPSPSDAFALAPLRGSGVMMKMKMRAHPARMMR